jgi:hypothetical protein
MGPYSIFHIDMLSSLFPPCVCLSSRSPAELPDSDGANQLRIQPAGSHACMHVCPHASD